jgi:hypothetical protein
MIIFRSIKYIVDESIALTMRHPLFAKVGTTSPTNGGRSVGIVRPRTKATTFSFRWILIQNVSSFRSFIVNLCQYLWSSFLVSQIWMFPIYEYRSTTNKIIQYKVQYTGFLMYIPHAQKRKSETPRIFLLHMCKFLVVLSLHDLISTAVYQI